MRLRRLLIPLAAGAALAGMAAGPAAANHSWGGYHWARTGSSFTLKLGDNLAAGWKSYLATTSGDWSASSVLHTPVVTGSAGRRCRGTTGRVEVCDSTYGNNGWLGIASISITGGTHITSGTVKLNDSYFNTAAYNTTPWRNLVMCQEVGHTLGLDHQDTTFDNPNLGTCMDYTNDPDGSIKGQLDNEHPNAHDYEELGSIYAHLDGTTTVGQSTGQSAAAAGAGNSQAEWGRAIRYTSDGKPSLFVRDAGDGEQVFTFVTWAE